MVQQLELFEHSLPVKPYSTDTLGYLDIRPKNIAMKRLYIQPNQVNEISSLVFDVDSPTAFFDWYDQEAPPPNLLALNQENGHAHLIYQLGKPVHVNHESRRNPIRFAAAVSQALRDKLQADRAYAGLITKNPFRGDHWLVRGFEKHPYDLPWLADYLDITPWQDQRKNLPAEGLGRNCTTFEVVRRWAYRRIREPWLSYEFWQSAVEEYALGYNALNFAVPLDPKEVHHIAKSIAKWVWENMSPEGFRRWAEARRAKSLRVRRAAAEVTKTAILAVKEAYPTATIRKIAEIVGCGRDTVHRILSDL